MMSEKKEEHSKREILLVRIAIWTLVVTILSCFIMFLTFWYPDSNEFVEDIRALAGQIPIIAGNLWEALTSDAMVTLPGVLVNYNVSLIAGIIFIALIIIVPIFTVAFSKNAIDTVLILFFIYILSAGATFFAIYSVVYLNNIIVSVIIMILFPIGIPLMLNDVFG